MPQVHSCHTTTGLEMSWGGGMSGPRICPPITTGSESGILAVGERLDPDHWKRLPAVHCMATQSVLSFMCGLDGRIRMVKYERFRQPCGVRNTACCLLDGTGEWQIGDRRGGVSCGDEQNEKSHGRSRGLLRRLQTSDQGPGKKNYSGSHGSSGEEGLDLVERREGPGGH